MSLPFRFGGFSWACLRLGLGPGQLHSDGRPRLRQFRLQSRELASAAVVIGRLSVCRSWQGGRWRASWLASGEPNFVCLRLPAGCSWAISSVAAPPSLLRLRRRNNAAHRTVRFWPLACARSLQPCFRPPRTKLKCKHTTQAIFIRLRRTQDDDACAKYIYSYHIDNRFVY